MLPIYLLCGAFLLSFVVYRYRSHYGGLLGFLYTSFLKADGFNKNPLKEDAYATFLEAKYKSQAPEYDSSRLYLLPGREALLRLAAAQIKHMRRTIPALKERKLIWVDVSTDTV